MKRIVRIDQLSLRVSGMTPDQARALARELPRHIDASAASASPAAPIRVKASAGQSGSALAQHVGEAINRSLKGGD